jgi:hypothetical protein
MALSAISFLKYAWWAACVSGWIGLPSYAQDLRMADNRAWFYLLSLIALQVATCATLWTIIKLNYADLSQFFRYGARLGASVAITLAGTASLIWILGLARYFYIR